MLIGQLGAAAAGLQGRAGTVEVGAAQEQVEVLGVPGDAGVVRQRVRAAEQERHARRLEQARRAAVKLLGRDVEDPWIASGHENSGSVKSLRATDLNG